MCGSLRSRPRTCGCISELRVEEPQVCPLLWEDPRLDAWGCIRFPASHDYPVPSGQVRLVSRLYGQVPFVFYPVGL